MQMTGNTIFITGGGSGIGRGLAEAFHRLGNKVIISGRRAERLQATIDANPGMASVELDVSDPSSITRVAAELIAQNPTLNVLINNAGIMLLDHVDGAIDEYLLVSTVTTNFGGPIRLSAALVDHLKAQANAVIVNVTSVLGFVPLVPTAIYSATKAALHSYTLSQRYALRSAGVQVIELVPPWVRTDLLNSAEEARAMPLPAFIEEAMAQFADGADEILVGEAASMRANPGADEHGWVTEFNNLMTSGPALG
jgi:uncharacterized oxidoreductase